MQQEFHVEALWDDQAEVYYSKSDIPGLNIETATLGEFEICLNDLAPTLLIENVLKPALEDAVLANMVQSKPKMKTPSKNAYILPPVSFTVPERSLRFAYS